MEDKIKIIVSKLVKEGIDMNAFLKISAFSIQEKIEEAIRVYCEPMKKSRHIRKELKY
ncbi:hypothetical protein [Cardinium endosymbiont of Dermatophagoides farinae]|uniref:hypothetical protein n=1 Tax=Cardinium endosymbiont of Dermatophagoides farinae TaxID=2597823 RepID=UPI001642AF8A|nr:hypothetical protein [Cardinium endosymbiont of Dermatophagoides farinae]